ncbi:MAG TPA: glycine cleavage system protein GcvH [Coxiellaceae bacterium]|nr:glycine cleavage system protein GcvH [Coxiellaceae bacterium]
MSNDNCPNDLYYARTHEWARAEEDGTVTVGITDHAQHLLGELVYVELPEVGASLDAGDDSAVVESVKTASDVYAPVSGQVIAINERLVGKPDLVNEEPYADGWLYRLRMNDEAELEDLMKADAYLHSIED